MRVVCYLRRLRGERTLREVGRAAGMTAGQLSELERGIRLATDAQIPRLEQAYGAPVEEWYDPRTLLVLQQDEPA